MARIRPVVALAVAAVVLVIIGAGIWATLTGVSSATAAKPHRSPSGSAPMQSGSTAATTNDAPALTATVHAASAPSTVAAVFGANSTTHTCSAGVIASITHDLLITAAHCVSGAGTGITVVPGYDAGRTPYGTWSVTAVFVDPAWASHQSEDNDFAILRVAPQKMGGVIRLLQDVTGAMPLGTTPAAPQDVTVQGFNAGMNDQSVVCTTELAFKRGEPVFRCDGYVGGSSGSPWMVTGADHVTRTVGVIGGLNQGGCKEQRSFSSDFGTNVISLLTRAEGAGTEGDDAPTVPPPACASPSTS